MADALIWKNRGLRKRRNVLTHELTAGICDAIVMGMHEIDAARALGVPRSTLNDWKKRGEHEPDSIYERFAECISQAISIRNNVLVQNIKDKSEGSDTQRADWRADAWLLQRQSGDLYSENVQPIDMGNPVTGASFDPAKLDALPEADKRALESILKKLAGGSDDGQAAGFTGSIRQLPAREPAE